MLQQNKKDIIKAEAKSAIEPLFILRGITGFIKN